MVSDPVRADRSDGRERNEALEVEQSYWEGYEDYDWSSDTTKARALDFVPRLDGDILELCIGAGAFAKMVPRSYRSYTGLDLSRTLLDALNAHLPHVKTIHGDAQDLPFEDGSYDTVLLFSGLHHLPKMEQSLAEAFRVLRSGGCYFCFEPNDRAWYRAPMRFLRNRKAVRDFIEIYSDDETYLDPDAVSAAMSEAGFVDVRVDFMTPRFNPEFLGTVNRFFALILYMLGAMGDGINTQSYFALSGRKP